LIVMFHGRVMEAGPAREVFSNPQHPYTEQLMIGSDPEATPRRRVLRPRSTVPLDVSAIGESAGARCRYAERCSYVHDRCLEAEPPLIPVAAGRSSRCWLAEPQALDSGPDNPAAVRMGESE
jgi:oligopeptide/dipeptide ABC transporter ATP-binding protein